MAGKFPRIICTLIISFLFLSLISPKTQQVMSQTTRKGGWVDTIIYDEVPYEEVLPSLNEGSLDIYANSLTPEDMLAVSNNPSLETQAKTSDGLYYELTFNPSGPVFSGTGKLNPFAKPRIREAMNLLVNRELINDSFFSGLALERYLVIPTNSFDYQKYDTKINELLSEYSYDIGIADAIITQEMLDLGAVKDEYGLWTYHGEPVELIFLIRNDGDGKRILIGDYVAGQLEAIGFTVTRQYISGPEAAPIWLWGNPADGAWHVYTGAWTNASITRDASDHFQFFYTEYSYYGAELGSPLYLSYEPTSEFLNLAINLDQHNFASEADFNLAYERALELAMEDSVRIFLIDGRFFFPHRANLVAAYNNHSGIVTPLWPLTARYIESEGGLVRAGISDLFVDAWNPYQIAGIHETPIVATSDFDFFEHPFLGVPLRQRIDHAEVVLPANMLYRNSVPEWLTVTQSSSISIPDDAWMVWDANAQRFLTASEADPYTLNRLAESKSIVTYQDDLFDVSKWHDGSPLTIADFIINMILEFDRLNDGSMMYDADYASLSHITSAVRAIRITSLSPLTIETYLSGANWEADTNIITWWPARVDFNVYYNPSTPWHTTALAVLAETSQQLAFGALKAEALLVPQTDYIRGDSLGILDGIRQTISYQTLPYYETLSQFITTDEFNTRYANLANWYAEHGHFWVSNGPYYLDSADETATPQMVLGHFDPFPDDAGKWDQFTQGSLEELVVDYSTGAPGSTFTLIGQDFPPNSEATVSLNWVPVGSLITDAYGSFTATLEIPTDLSAGIYIITVSVNPTYSVMITIDPSYPVRTHEPLHDHIVAQSTILPIFTEPITAPVQPVALGSNIEVFLPFEAAGLDGINALWTWGDSTSSAGLAVNGRVTGTHVYSEPGVYPISLSITGGFKGEIIKTYEYIVVYDSEGSFVTGGGWIWSPPGAYSEDPTLEGKATFGFVSKYKKGTMVPTGQTEFQFNLADLKFHSSSYDWLVVSGKKATFKGIGTINGAGEYKFMISAIDGNLYKEALPDTFRIKIWVEENGTEIVVYDNQLGSEITSDPTTVLSGGSIVIH